MRPARVHGRTGQHWMAAAPATTVVPASPRSMRAVSSSAPMHAGRPVASANSHAASTFGPIDPAGKVRVNGLNPHGLTDVQEHALIDTILKEFNLATPDFKPHG